MVQYDKYILNKLLDKYESSLLFTGENTRAIHIEFPFLKTSIPAYFDESSGEYEKIHVYMKNLEEKQFVLICWKGKKEGHIISKVRLNIEMLEESYKYVNRIPKNDIMFLNQQLLENYMGENSTPICKAFAKFLQKRFEEHKSVKEFIRLEDLKGTKQILDTIQAVEKNNVQLYIREFSIIHFQDSKAFEKIESKVAHIFKKFKEGCESSEFDEILAEYGIYRTPNYVYLKGNAIIKIGEEIINLSELKQGLGISGEDISRIKFIDMGRIKKVLTIENLTTYFRWREDNSLLIYLGGYHNSLRRTLLEEIYSCHPDASYYHFGDIDAGGFEIFRNLREKTGIPFKMYKMDLETLQLYKDFGKPLTDNDRKRLYKMCDREGLKNIINYMLKHNIKLEQECIGYKL